MKNKTPRGIAVMVLMPFLLMDPVLQPAVSQTREFLFEGVKRTYILNVPSSYDGGKAVPLLLGLHGYSSTAERSRSNWGLDALSESKGFIVAYPNALAYPVYQMWNAGDLYDVWANHTNDVGFIAALIDSLVRAYRIDKARIFVTGHSNGSFMAYRVAAELSTVVAAIAPVAGQMVLKDCFPLRPVPIIHFHALDDATVPYNGANVSGMTVPPVESVIALWAKKNGCAARVDTVYKQNGIVGRQWPSPGHAGDVALYTTTKGGHTWLKESNSGLAMNSVMWAFFEAHPMIQSTFRTEKIEPPVYPCLMQNFPNPCNPSTVIPYRTDASGKVRISVHDAAGRNIRTLVNAYRDPGIYLIRWNGTDHSGRAVGSGVYLARMETDQRTDVRKMILVR